MNFIIGLVFIVIILLIGMIPSWLLLLCYDYVAQQVGWVTLEITFLNVFCLSVVLAILRGIFKNK